MKTSFEIQKTQVDLKEEIKYILNIQPAKDNTAINKS